MDHLPALNASSALSPSLSPSHLPQPTAFQFGGFNQNQWGPDAISTIFFGVVMFFIGVTALWQGRLRQLRHEEDEEQGQRARVGGQSADLTDEFAMVDFPEGFRSDRVAVGVDEPAHEDDTTEQKFVNIKRGIRTDTERTLIGHNNDGGEMKELED